MRPEQLEMTGFAPFRAPVSLDFSGVDLFALTGPTGAGKSSVIDAITFALYGSVARYDRKSVEPIVSLGVSETRVRFEFEVEGEHYSVARVVRRTSSGGASTAEARLERDGDVLASGAAEVTRVVEGLLGLGLDHFTRSVVLPQGEFAAFLHDTPGGQQDLVKALLDMGVLDSVRRLAAERAKTATALAESARSRLDHLADATDEAEARAAANVERLEKLVDVVADGEAALVEAESELGRRTEAVELLLSRRSVAEISLPEGLEQLAESLKATKESLAAAEAELVEADGRIEALEEESGSIPTLDALEATIGGATDLEKAVARRDAIDTASTEAELTEVLTAVTAAREARLLAESKRDDARRRHAAHALVEGSDVGDPCPVCDRPLESVPAEPPADLADTQRTWEEAGKTLDEAVERHRDIETRLAGARAAQKAAVEAVAAAEARMAGAPSGSELEILVARRRKLDEALGSARDTVKAARQGISAARDRMERLVAGERESWELFSSARDAVAHLSPPPESRDDLATAWKTLVGWSRTTVERLDQQLLEGGASVEEAQEATAKHREELERMLGEAGVTGSGTASARVASSLATARADRDRVRERLQERQGADQDLERFRESATVAGALGAHMRSNRFEGWLLSEALTTLVDGANELLAQLTHDAYSLTIDDRSIEVVDRRNADERRSVRSLSGGETFLVSLALALSLGEQLLNLSDRGATRLGAIFLDEGFGSLDGETLETVTAVVTELAARGRVVGVVTHVKELAEQVPVRFEVRPGPSGSTVEKVVVG